MNSTERNDGPCNGPPLSDLCNDEQLYDHMNASMQSANADKLAGVVSKKDKQSDKKWRSIVLLVLLANALIIIGATYVFLANQEKNDFDSKVSANHATTLSVRY